MAYQPQNPNGQATMANSEPVVIASDQTAVPVSSTTLATSAKQLADNHNVVVTSVPSTPVTSATFATSAKQLADNHNVIVTSAPSTPVTSATFATAAKQPALGTAGTASADVISVQGIANGTALAVSLATAPTTAVTLAAGAASIGKAEDVASADADVGVPAFAIQKSTPANTAGTDGDYEALQISAGRLWTSTTVTGTPAVTITAGATTIAKLEDVASADADAGVPAMAVQKLTPANTAGTDGDYEMLQISAGRLWASAKIDTALPTGTNTIGTVNQQTSNRSDTYTATGNGVTVNVATTPFKSYAIQVVGTGGGATSWDVRLESSLDNVNFTQVLQHTNTTGNGVVLFSGATLYPSLYFRSRCAGLILGVPSDIVVFIVGLQ